MTGPILLASYPKSGNTWLRALLAGLEHGRVDINDMLEQFTIASSRLLFDQVMGVDSSDLTDAEVHRVRADMLRRVAEFERDRWFLKVHDARLPATPDAEDLFPADVVRAVVHIVRDPRDVAVSWAHHTGRSIDVAIAQLADPGQTLARSTIRMSRQLPQFTSNWSRHVESWLGATDLAVHLVRYEDLLADTTGALTAIAAFLGLEVDEAAIASTVEAASFSALRAQEERNGFRERRHNQDRFFRRGVAGGWRDTLSAAQTARIESDHGPMMLRLGYLP
ncbi:MAG: sulfotransferase domain-containing protein [Alphaproteobacteria bacterium]